MDVKLKVYFNIIKVEKSRKTYLIENEVPLMVLQVLWIQSKETCKRKICYGIIFSFGWESAFLRFSRLSLSAMALGMISRPNTLSDGQFLFI